MKLMRLMQLFPQRSTTTDTLEKIWMDYRLHPLTIISGLIALFAIFHFSPLVYNAYSIRTPQTCTQFLENYDYTKDMSLQKTQQLEAIQFINQITGGQPSVLIQIINTIDHRDSGVYVYGCRVQQGTLIPISLLKNSTLSQGTVTVTENNTLIIGELDTSLTTNRIGVLLPLQEYIYQEYAWKNGGLQRISFPGLYPVLSQNEAEALQTQADNGDTEQWNDPSATAKQMAQDLLQWNPGTITASMIQETTSQAEILLAKTHSLTKIVVTLQRLQQNNAQGLWFVTAVHSQSNQLIQKALQRSSASSIHIVVQEKPDNQHARITAMLFDHTTTPLATRDTTLLRQADGTYAGTLTLPTDLTEQPGLLLLRSQNNSNHQETDQIQLGSIDLP